MLEEGLKSPTFSPTEAAQGLLSFVRYELPDGGASAEKRFIGLFSLLCDRFFGPMGSAKDDYRHEVGGWLSRQQRWDHPENKADSSSPRKPIYQLLKTDPVVHLLCGMESLNSKSKLPTYIEAISSNAEPRRSVRVQFPFHALPKPTQKLVISLVKASMEGKDADTSARSNAARLFGELLRVPAKDQPQIRKVQESNAQKKERNRPLSLSPGRIPPPGPANASKETASPHLMLSMIEYFLFTFIRYPIAPPIPTRPAPQGHPGSRRARKSNNGYGDALYLHLFEAYLLHFLPNADPKQAFLGFSSLRQDSEIFVRTLMEFWLCGEVNFAPLEKAATEILERRRRASSHLGLPPLSLGLDSIFEMTKDNFDPPPEQGQKCLRMLVMHVLKNPNLTHAVNDCDEMRRTMDAEWVEFPWCLSASMTILQQPFFSYIAASFRHAPIHVRGSVFFTAFETWLLWLEPWNVEFREYL
mmetsp:Transcript_23526/g.54679  ORF Transcript_23526/g.54679 Transcript_23526/m.54679 type:complete len:471 (+) Transcript_23526:211-1623(+)